MAEESPPVGRTLNSTFLPATLLRKNQNKLATSLNSRYEFEKTSGNAFITIDPPEIKFTGYELDRSYTAIVRIINRAPVPQRITLIPPETSSFSIKTNKKGSIASGMSENITVLFRSSEYKYQTDMVSLRTETENFLIPLYAYPSLPDLRNIFPKVIDFGAIECKEPSIYQYPIVNSVPLNFEFEFEYLKESQEISINPLKGVIEADSTTVVEITFIPTTKSTSRAEVMLHVHQFDFQPLPIKIIGSGMQKLSKSQPRRIKSSKLAPLKEGEEDRENKKGTRSIVKRRPSGESQLPAKNQLEKTVNFSQLGNSMKRSQIRTSYPKLMSMRKTVGEEEENKTMNPAKIAEREFLNRFTRIQDLDKEKDIKFAEYLGDKAMTQNEIQFEKQLSEELTKARLAVLEKKCKERVNPQLSDQAAVEFKVVPKKEVTWDDKQNDEYHGRRKALNRFMNAGTKVILHYRLVKRLGKIKDLLSTCKDKKAVRKLVEDSYSKAIDREQGFFFVEDIELSFDSDSVRPTFYEQQFEEKQQKASSLKFEPEGKTSFDDLSQIKEILPHNIDKYKFTQLTFSGDYYNHNSYIPPHRQSAEEEMFFKTSALDQYTPPQPTTAYDLPLKVSAHHFIYDNNKIKRYYNYASADEKDPQVCLESGQKVEDQFEGWTGGQYEILKYKFTRNLGCNYQTYSGYNFSTENFPLPPLSTLSQDLPTVILQPSYQDTLQKEDSDQEDLQQTPVQSSLKFLQQIEGGNQQLKERRERKEITNPEKAFIAQIQKSLGDLKTQAVGQFVGRVKESNKWVQSDSNRILL